MFSYLNRLKKKPAPQPLLSHQALMSFLQANPDATVKQFFDFVTKDGKLDLDIHAIGRSNCNVLHAACEIGNVNVASALVKMGAKINQQADEAYTPLIFAVKGGHLPVVQFLVKHGADVHALTYEGKDCVAYVPAGKHALRNYLVTQQKLAPRSGDPLEKLCRRRELRTQFNKALEIGYYHAAKKLLDENGSEIDLMSNGDYKHSSIYNAACKGKGHLQMVQLLVQHGDVLIDHYDRLPVAYYARKLGHNEIADFLEKTQAERYQILKAEAEKECEPRTRCTA